MTGQSLFFAVLENRYQIVKNDGDPELFVLYPEYKYCMKNASFMTDTSMSKIKQINEDSSPNSFFNNDLIVQGGTPRDIYINTQIEEEGEDVSGHEDINIEVHS